MTSDSVTPGYPFTDYSLVSGTEKIYVLTDIVPQYYEFAGHAQDDGSAVPAHPTAGPLTTPAVDLTTLNGAIPLDYTNTGEIWITLYIRPRGTPMDQQTGTETNRFGTVYLP